MGKGIRIHRIVRLLQILRQWRLRAATAAAPPDVPAGHVAVVCMARGSSSRARFVVRASHLNHPAFRELLRRAEEEYGFPSGRSGPLALPCDESVFRRVLQMISTSSASFSSRWIRKCCLEDLDMLMLAGDSMPLLHGHRLADEPVW